MNIPFAFCLTPGEYRRAVHSLRLDVSLLTVLAGITGDDAVFGWRRRLPRYASTATSTSRPRCTGARCVNSRWPGSRRLRRGASRAGP